RAGRGTVSEGKAGYDLLLMGCRAVAGPSRMIEGARMGIRAGRIAAIDAGATALAGPTRSLFGLTVLPGFIDLHIHGVGGGDAHAGGIPARAPTPPAFGRA